MLRRKKRRKLRGPSAGNYLVDNRYSAGDIQRFTEEFGENGVEWLLAGKTFEECQTLHAVAALDAKMTENEALTAEISKLRDEIDWLKARLAVASIGGETSPIEFNDADGSKTSAGKRFTGLNDGLARFAAAVKMPVSKN